MNFVSDNEDSENEYQQGHTILAFDLDDNVELKWFPANQNQQLNKARAAANQFIFEAASNDSMQNTMDFHHWRATIEVATA